MFLIDYRSVQWPKFFIVIRIVNLPKDVSTQTYLRAIGKASANSSILKVNLVAAFSTDKEYPIHGASYVPGQFKVSKSGNKEFFDDLDKACPKKVPRTALILEKGKDGLWIHRVDVRQKSKATPLTDGVLIVKDA